MPLVGIRLCNTVYIYIRCNLWPTTRDWPYGKFTIITITTVGMPLVGIRSATPPYPNTPQIKANHKGLALRFYATPQVIAHKF